MKVTIFTLTLIFSTFFNALSQDNTSNIIFKKGKIIANGKVYSNVNQIRELFAKIEDREIHILVQKYNSQKRWSNALGISGLLLLAGGMKANIDRNGNTTIYEKMESLSGSICLGLGISLNRKSSKTLNTAIGLYNFEQKKEIAFASGLFTPEIRYTISF